MLCSVVPVVLTGSSKTSVSVVFLVVDSSHASPNLPTKVSQSLKLLLSSILTRGRLAVCAPEFLM